MKETKIQLSADELQLMRNSEWILTKNRIIEKVSRQFGALAALMQEELSGRNPLAGEIGTRTSPKISRGENYQGLPYVMLDYPRHFEKEHVLAIRTFFWWGNFCSMTLHVKGRFRANAWQNILKNEAVLIDNQVYISARGNEWNHDVNSSDYEALSASGTKIAEVAVGETVFIKVAVKVDFSCWNNMESILLNAFIMLVNLVEA